MSVGGLEKEIIKDVVKVEKAIVKDVVSKFYTIAGIVL